jgi:hypothetical protein
VNLEVTVTDASMADIVDVAVDFSHEIIGTTTLGDVIAKRLVDALTADERWPDLAERFAAAAERFLADAAPGFIEELVAREVTRQLQETDRRAMVRGRPATTAEAIVATEVTTQLREKFTPVVTQTLAALKKDLEAAAADSVASFRRGVSGG